MAQILYDSLLKMYKSLVKYSMQKDEIGEVNENFELRIAVILVLECERHIRYVEHKEIPEFNEMQLNIQKLLSSIYKFKTFESNCEDLMRYTDLHSKARQSLANILPKLEEDVTNVIHELQRMILAIENLHTLPVVQEKNEIKNNQLEKLIEIFKLVTVRYNGFDDRLQSLINHVEKEMHIQQNRCLYLEEAANYLDGKSDEFLSLMQEDDNGFIKTVFGRSRPEIQDVLRNSLKEVMLKRGFDLEETRKMAPLPEMQKNLQTKLETYFADLLEFQSGCNYIKYIFVPIDLRFMQNFFLKLQKLKRNLHVILGDRSPFLIF